MADGEAPNTGGAEEEVVAHGGDIDAARRRFPAAPEPWIDLSTGINPVPYPLPDLAPEAWTRLPTADDLAGLLATARRRYGVTAGSAIIAAPGTQALIQLLPRLFPATVRVAVLGETYAEHARGWRRHGHTVTIAAHPADLLRDGTRVAVIVNPDNPTGRLVPPAVLSDISSALAARGGLLVVDEAFVDVLDDGTSGEVGGPHSTGGSPSIVPALPPATVVLRSFGKTYGLAGVRLGFAIAAPGLAARIGSELGPWAVPGPAIAIGRSALADDAWLDVARARLAADSARLDRVLAAAGAKVVGGTPLFRLFTHQKAQALTDHLGHNGIHVRRFAALMSHVRVGLPGSASAWARLEIALQHPSDEF